MASQQQLDVKHVDDIFDASVNLEKIHYNDGYNLGYTDGLVSGKEEAIQVGLKRGFEVGEELGFYKGCVDVWTSAIRIDPTLFSPRIQKRIKTMEDLLRKYPILEPEDESGTDIMDSLRQEFRPICATLGLKLEYNGYPKSVAEVKDVGF